MDEDAMDYSLEIILNSIVTFVFIAIIIISEKKVEKSNALLEFEPGTSDLREKKRMQYLDSKPGSLT